MTGILGGLRQASLDRQKITATRDKRRREDELYDLKSKKLKLQMDELIAEGKADPAMVHFVLEKEKEQATARKAQGKVYDSESDQGLFDANQRQEELMSLGKKALYAEAIKYMKASSINASGGITYKPKDEAEKKDRKVTSADKALGVLSTGGEVDSAGEITPFEGREVAMAYANSELGHGWQKKFPEAMGLIEKNFPSKSTGEITLPKEVKNISGAIKYLTKEKNMSEEEAKQWIKDNN